MIRARRLVPAPLNSPLIAAQTCSAETARALHHDENFAIVIMKAFV